MQAALETPDRHQIAAPPMAVPARRALFAVAAGFCLTPWASPPLALALGVGLALLVHNPFAALGRRVAKYLLQACVVFLGFNMKLPVVLKTGGDGLLLAAGTIGLTLGLGYAVGKWLKVGNAASALISAGTAICGGSAIAAVGSVIAAEEGAMAVALGTVFILNAVALYAFPLVGHALHLTQGEFGTWAGVAIHDISSVVGAATVYGRPALQVATAVKLSRALWIVPVSVAAAMAAKRRRGGGGGKVQVPWFIGLFLLASVAGSSLPAVAAAGPTLQHVATVGLTLTLFLIGGGMSLAMLREVGWRPLAQGVILWVFISVGSLGVIRWIG